MNFDLVNVKFCFYVSNILYIAMVVFIKEIAIEKKINNRELDKRQWYYLNSKKGGGGVNRGGC